LQQHYYRRTLFTKKSIPVDNGNGTPCGKDQFDCGKLAWKVKIFPQTVGNSLRTVEFGQSRTARSCECSWSRFEALIPRLRGVCRSLMSRGRVCN